MKGLISILLTIIFGSIFFTAIIVFIYRKLGLIPPLKQKGDKKDEKHL